MASGQFRPRFAMPAASLALILLAALAIRLFDLSARSLWLDEVRTSFFATVSTPGDVIARAQELINQMPLYYLAVWLLHPLGTDELVLRLPAAIAGALAVGAEFLLARRLFGLRVAIVASVLSAVAPYAVWFSQEARAYSFFMLFTTLQMYFAYRCVKEGRALDWLGLGLFTTFNLYTHYFAWAATAAAALYVGAFLVRDIFRVIGARLSLGIGLGLIVLAAAAFALRRPYLSDAYAELGKLRLALHGGAGLLAVAAAAIALITAYWILRRRSSIRLAAWACGACLILLVLLVLIPRLALPSGPGADLPLPVAGAIVLTAALLAVAATRLLLEMLRKTPVVARKTELAIGCGLLIGIAYIPWLHAFHTFLDRRDQSLNRLGDSGAGPVDNVQTFLSQLDLSGVALLAFGIGLLAIGAWIFRGKAAESMLILSWLAVPMVGFLAVAGPRVLAANIRYFSFLFPAIVLTIAIAVEGLALVAAAGLRRVRSFGRFESPTLLALLSAILVAPLLVQAVPALAASYAIPKDDYRGAAKHIIAASPPGSVVLALGQYSSFAVDCFGYYLHQLHADVAVVDSNAVDRDNVSNLTGRSGVVWGVLVFPTAAELSSIGRTANVVNDYTDATGDVRLFKVSDSGADPIDQAEILMRWEVPQQPKLNAPLKLLEWMAGHATLGPNLVTAPGSEGWTWDQGASAGQGTITISLNGSKPLVSATYTASIASDRDFIVNISCRNGLSGGSQRIFAIAIDPSGAALDTFPDGGGLLCGRHQEWASTFFVFDVPATTAVIRLVLRAQGTGIAEFESLELRSLTETA